MGAYQQEMIAQRASEAEANKAKGDAFMQANAAKEGVKAMADGVQYKEITTGTGATPAATDKVRVHYTGTLIDGTEFDSSRSRGEPTELTVGDVIPGWQAALAQMPVGSRWMVWIPPEQAYGMRGAGATIGPNETLVFDIELLEILPAQ
jgi:FKBP-type peptidyl-prolyl cis-trans isomerase